MLCPQDCCAVRGLSTMARVSDEMLREVRRELAQFKQAPGHQSAYAAAHLAGAVEALLGETEPEPM